MIHSLCQTKTLSFTLSACFFLAALTVLLSLCPFALSFTLFVYGSAPRDASRLVQNAGAPAASLSPGLRSAPRPAPSQRLHCNSPAAAFYLEYFSYSYFPHRTFLSSAMFLSSSSVGRHFECYMFRSLLNVLFNLKILLLRF